MDLSRHWQACKRRAAIWSCPCAPRMSGKVPLIRHRRGGSRHAAPHWNHRQDRGEVPRKWHLGSRRYAEHHGSDRGAQRDATVPGPGGNLAAHEVRLTRPRSLLSGLKGGWPGTWAIVAFLCPASSRTWQYHVGLSLEGGMQRYLTPGAAAPARAAAANSWTPSKYRPWVRWRDSQLSPPSTTISMSDWPLNSRSAVKRAFRAISAVS